MQASRRRGRTLLSGWFVLLSALRAVGGEDVQQVPEIVSVRKIWDGGEHNAFTDLIRFRERWWCTFREAAAHGGSVGNVRVLVSDDGDDWSSAALISAVGSERGFIDLRDPKLSVMPDGRMMLVMGGSLYHGKQYFTRSPRLAFSRDGRAWSEPTKVLAEDHWLWRVTWYKGKAYSVSKLGEGRNPRRGMLYSSSDGLGWDWVTEFVLPEGTWNASETTLRFLPGDELVALVRPEWIGRSRPPYTEWEWTRMKHRIGGPNFVRLPDGSLWGAGRRYGEGGATTALARMTATSYEPVLDLPSGGDTSYPGMVWHDGLLWMSYYSSHEGKTSIYLAKIRLPLQEAHPATERDLSHYPIRVVEPRRFKIAQAVAVRTPLGIPEDYKPWLARTASGELLLVCFHAGRKPLREHAVFWRSTDGGKTWGPREPRPDIAGREFSLNALRDGTLLMTCHFLASDVNNAVGHTYSKVLRSTDQGVTWSEERIGPDGFPRGAQTVADWTVVEVPETSRPGSWLTLLGVSMQDGDEAAADHVYLWRSQDSGRTWDRSLRPDTKGWTDVDGFFAQSASHRTRAGKLLHVVRVDRTGPHWRIPVSEGGPPQVSNDHGDRMMLWTSTDDGRSWEKANGHGTFGTYGEMYPRFLELSDGRLLLTFTVRSQSTDGHALGLRAIVSDDDGTTWDFAHDRLVIDYQNRGASGGGFGNTVQNDDGSLVSCYSYRGVDGKTHVEVVQWQLPLR